MLNNIYNLFFKRLFSFKGRSSRKEYITRFLLTAFICITWSYTKDFQEQEGILPFIYVILISVLMDIYIFQYFPLAVRRFHDINSSGWWIMLSFVPFGQLVILWLMFKKGTPEPNRYGKSPNNYDENDTTLQYNLLVFCGIILLTLLFGFYLNSLREDREYSIIAAKTALEYYKKENYEEALKGLNIAIYFTPKDAYLYRVRGDILLTLKRYDEAIQDYDKVIKLNINELDAYNKKIFILFKQFNYNEALKMCDLVSERTSDKNHLIYVYIMKANILNKMAQYKESLIYIEKALSLEPNNNKAISIKKYSLKQLK